MERADRKAHSDPTGALVSDTQDLLSVSDDYRIADVRVPLSTEQERRHRYFVLLEHQESLAPMPVFLWRATSRYPENDIWEKS